MGYSNKGTSSSHHYQQMMYNKHGGGGVHHSHHHYGGDGMHQQQQSSHHHHHHHHHVREPQSFTEPELTAEQAEVLRKKRLERFGPVEPAEPSLDPASKAASGLNNNEHKKPGGVDGTSKERCKRWPNCNKTDD